jgi:hypothetical protein
VARYRILSWRGIPAQLKVYREDGRPRAEPLADWFVTEIDRVAMREGIVAADEYLALWEWSDELERDGTPEDVAAAVRRELEDEWLPQRAR